MKAVIFDMDGVITDSEPVHIAAEQAVLDKHGITIAQTDWDTFKGKTPHAIFSHIIKTYNVSHTTPEEMANDKIYFYLEFFKEKISLFPDFIPLAEYLASKYILALTTSSPEPIARRVFETFGIDKYFKVVVTGDMVKNGKPDPEPYLLTLKKLGLPASECIVIEDSDNGILSAQAASIPVIGITHTFPRERLAQATHIVDNLREIQDLL